MRRLRRPALLSLCKRKLFIEVGGARRKIIGKDDRGRKIFGDEVSGSTESLKLAMEALQARTDARAANTRSSKSYRRPGKRA
jgi:hypothetical protein